MNIFRSLKYYNYRLHFTGQAISLIGTWMQRVAISWLVYRLTGSAFLLGFITFASLIPSLFLSPYAGSFIDRHDKFKVLLVTQAGLMLQAGLLALMIWFQYYSIMWIGILSLLQGIINSFDVTARQALMVDLVDNKEDLPNAIALNATVFNSARLVGPALAGIILSTFGEEMCFTINFVSFIAVLICLLCMKLDIKPSMKATENIWSDLKEGFYHIKNSPNVLSLILTMAASSLLIIPFITLLPVFAKDIFHGDAGTFSWFESAAGLGALFGAIYMARLRKGISLHKVTIISGFIMSFSVIALSIAPSLVPALIFTAAAGIGLMVQNSSINTYIQTHSTPEMRGRTISYYIMANQGILPIGSLLIGFLAHLYGAQTVVFIEGIAGFIITAALLYYKLIRNVIKGKLYPIRIKEMLRTSS
ncbi:transporter, putative [Arcticibacter svalbardensis MN12-7]|uniref:Transporter, putative n=1 Tax=Arcticibacter svalbardensis MN12-7 TaxID=1150600 RepID=R9GP46_9SPHI|nr:MFS transporter [Arcticibacter svalbardensis]EOR93607.1 transporter, putative [Arcticibacter svalbardensis MN12-7]